MGLVSLHISFFPENDQGESLCDTADLSCIPCSLRRSEETNFALSAFLDRDKSILVFCTWLSVKVGTIVSLGVQEQETWATGMQWPKAQFWNPVATVRDAFFSCCVVKN